MSNPNQEAQKSGFKEYLESCAIVPYRRILVGVDHSYTSARIFERALKLAQIFCAKLYVVHVIPTKLPYQTSSKIEIEPEYYDIMQEKAQDMIKLTKKRMAETGVEGDASIIGGDPAGEILKATATMNIDLVVMGAKEKVGTLAHMGSVSKRVSEEAKCSVMIERVSS
ncbi:MAG: universal stress protein [Candidatus Methanomethylicaceae archaeon]|jgi:nucleotide-binding universal stress UspA family protein